MTKPMMFFVPAILIMPLATGLVTVQTSLAEPAVDECKTKPDSSAPAGSHWYYRVSRTDQRHCWYLGPEGRKVRSPAREGASPTRTARENAPEMTRAIPAQMEATQKSAAGAASTGVAGDFAAPSADLPKIPDLTTQEPAIISNGYAEDHQATKAQEEMPLIWPVLTGAERAALPDSVGESVPWSAFLVGALALLLAAAIFKLARRHVRSYRRDQHRVGRPRPRQRPRRAYSGHIAARTDQVARRSALRTQHDETGLQRPTSIRPVEAATLRKLMRDLQRAAA